VERLQEKGTELLLSEAEQNKEFRKEAIESNEGIKEELRVLHDQINQRDEIIAQIQQNPDLTNDIKSIIEASQARLLEEEKEIQSKSENLGLKKLLMEDGDPEIVSTEDSCYLAPSEIVKIVEKQKEHKKKLSKDKKKISKLKKEIETMKEKVTDLAKVDQTDLEAIANTMADDKLEDIKDQYNVEKEKILNDLTNRINKVCDLEMQLDIQQEEYAKLEYILNNSSSSDKKQIRTLTENVQSLGLMYSELSSEKSALMVEVKVTQKKLKSTAKKLDRCKEDLKNKVEENKKLRRIAEKLRDAVENEHYVQSRKTFNNTNAGGRLVKRIRR